jgi:site-specific DNA-methyltransferase (adenine-specific)
MRYLNTAQKCDGLEFLARLPNYTIPLVFFDPQYRQILDQMKYGNEGEGRGRRRGALPQMSPDVIRQFGLEIERILRPSGHVFLWVDKFVLCNFRLTDVFGKYSRLQIVDMITWDKRRIAMGYRSRRRSEHLLIFQKNPKRAKGVWTDHRIPDVWREVLTDKRHVHQKPIKLQRRLIKAVTKPGDIVVDPCAGSFSVLQACLATERKFLGCDIMGPPPDFTS